MTIKATTNKKNISNKSNNNSVIFKKETATTTATKNVYNLNIVIVNKKRYFGMESFQKFIITQTKKKRIT